VVVAQATRHSEIDYAKVLFGSDQFWARVTRLRGMTGLFILSIDEVLETCALLQKCAVREAELQYRVLSGE
jgi:hypothetical protein